MSLILCSVVGCGNRIREGLKRTAPSVVDGHDLADGKRCWRCRAGRSGHIRRGAAAAADREHLVSAAARVQAVYDGVCDVLERSVKSAHLLRALHYLASARADLERAVEAGEGDSERRVAPFSVGRRPV